MRVGGIEVVFSWDPPSIAMVACVSTQGGNVPWYRFPVIVRPKPSSVDHHGRPVDMPEGEYWDAELNRLGLRLPWATIVVRP